MDGSPQSLHSEEHLGPGPQQPLEHGICVVYRISAQKWPFCDSICFLALPVAQFGDKLLLFFYHSFTILACPGEVSATLLPQYQNFEAVVAKLQTGTASAKASWNWGTHVL